MTDESGTVGPIGLGTWGSLTLLEEVGRGGFGRVYRAWEPALAREVALKIIRPSGDGRAAAAVLAEGQLLARVRHTNVVTVHGAQEINGEIGLWMEFVRGESLSDLVKRQGRRAAGEAAVVGISLCQALAAVHNAGIIHRDIKGQNVMRESGGRIVLMDFGAGQLLRADRLLHESPVGTPVYMAPEVLGGGGATPRSDIYSLGVLLYYLVTETFPVVGRSWTDILTAHARGDRRALGDLRPDIPAGFLRIVERATALAAAERYATAGSMLGELTEVAAGDPAFTPRFIADPVPPIDAVTGARTWRRLAAAALAGFVGIWILGTITSATFNHTLGRSAEFRGESVFGWWIWGLRALIPGAVQVSIVVLAWWLMTSFWTVVTKIVRRAPDQATQETGGRTRPGVDPDTAARALLAAQILALGAFCWYFRDLFAAVVSFIDAAEARDLEPLAPGHLLRHQMYNLVMSMLILTMTTSTWLMHRRQQHAGTPRSGPLRASFVVVGFALVILVFPYRLIWHNLFEIATYDRARCYVMGEAVSDLLIYCPDADRPRTRRVLRGDVRLTRTGLVESIYTHASTTLK